MIIHKKQLTHDDQMRMDYLALVELMCRDTTRPYVYKVDDIPTFFEFLFMYYIYFDLLYPNQAYYERK